MLNLISEHDVLPRSLFILNVRTEDHIGGHWNVRKGKHEGQPVALKVLYRSQKEVCLSEVVI